MGYQFSLTPSIVHSLQTIERVRENVSWAYVPPVVAEQLRLQAHIRSTHYSTRIEGNRLTLQETEAVIRNGQSLPDRKRDVLEVEHYYQALQQMERWVEERRPITERRIRKLHATLYKGRSTKPTPYRDGQNVIRDASGEIVYLPPEAIDVKPMMAELVAWVNLFEQEYPIPIIAGVAHYQFVTIHPFYDGNGRTARTLTTWILQHGKYDLGKFYSLEEFYSDDLQGYYDALVTHPHHNYYFGRNKAECTSWLDYFLRGMAVVFERVSKELHSISQTQAVDAESALLRDLDHRARRVLSLFSHQNLIRSSDVANVLGISVRRTRELLSQWVNQGWLEIADASRRGRKYRLAKNYRSLIK